MSVEKFSTPEFDANQPLTDEQLRERESLIMDETNWREDHSVPSAGEHYRYLWKWDSLKAVVINARRGKPDQAKTEIITMEKYRDRSTGFMPNKVFATTDRKTWRDYPEAWTFNNNKVGSSYSQPPIAAWSAMETYKSFKDQNREDEGLQFLQEIYGTAEEGNYTGLQGEHAYFINHRQNSKGDPLIAIVHPNETGRDSDEANKPWLQVKSEGPGAMLEWLRMQKLGHDLGQLGRDPENERVDWIPEQVRQKYWVNDVMFNAMHASNLRYLADVAGLLADKSTDYQAKHQYHEDISKYQQVADAVESEILQRMWNDEQGFFYNLDDKGNQIPVDSITGLFPLMLENISQEQASSLLDKLEDPEWFNTPYPIPTHAARSERYDTNPDWFKRTFNPPWSGPVWISANHLIVEEGLVPRAEDYADPRRKVFAPELAKRALENAGVVADKTKELLAINPKSMECYSATSGQGMRVQDFMWSNIGLHFEKYQAARQRHEELFTEQDNVDDENIA